MPTTVGTYTLTYPANNTDGGWYSQFTTYAQGITDHLDGISTGADLVTDSTPELGADLDLNGFDIIDINGNDILTFTTTALAANHIGIKNNSTTNHPEIQALGDDSNIDLVLKGKGTGSVLAGSDLQLGGNFNLNDNNFVDSNGNELAEFSKTASAINFVEVKNAATGNGAVIQADGDEANIDLAVAAKGTGVIKVLSDLEIGGSITLSADSTYSLGNSSAQWQGVYTDNISFDGTATFDYKSFAQAWMYYDQTTVPSIKDKYNISSVTDSASGKFIVNFSITWADTDYAVICGPTNMGNDSTTDTYVTLRNTTSAKTTTTCPMGTCYYDASTNKTYNDQNFNYVLWLGDT